MFWKQKPGWFGNQLDKNIEALYCGDLSRIPWIYCVFAENHEPSKLTAAKALRDILDSLSFDDIVRVDEQMRQTTSMEWSINWRDLNFNNFFTSQMDIQDKRALTVFASFNPSGFIREQAVKLMQNYDGTLPYIILRQNDWVQQVLQAAGTAFTYRLQRLSDGEILAALPFAEKLKWSSRGSHGEYTTRFFEVLTAPEHLSDLLKGLESKNVRTRRICVDALFGVTPPKIEMAFERLTREPEPFLRAAIFRKLSSLEQNLSSVVEVFLRDKYPVNRMLAFQYLLDNNMDSTYVVTKSLLLDKSAVLRESAQQVIQKQTPEFDFRDFYFDNLDRCTTAAILGIGENGQSGDAVILSKYLDDARLSVVKSTMASLMRLDSKKYSLTITEMLDDARAGVVKTARNLIMKTSSQDYEKVREVFATTAYKHTKLKCLDILFSASKWSSIIYMLEAVFCNDEQIKEKSLTAINRWLFSFNRSFALPSKKQSGVIKKLILELNGKLPSSIQKELKFALPN
ncbi:MAG: hypothetical protein FWG53_03650 [Clostridiales bacterium]|nr:hypothetical protein [Clostridiales bacterium]